MRTRKPDDAEALIQKVPSDMGIHRNPRKGTLNAPEKIMEGLEFEEEVFVSEIFPDEFSLEETHRKIEENTEELLEYGRPLVSLGGDHSVSFPVLKALKQDLPDLKLVWLDAHLDLKEPVNGHTSHDVVVRELLEHGFSEEEIVFIGITEVDHDEEEFLEEHDFTIYRAGEVSEALEKELFEGPTYLSVDIDVLTPEDAPGTGYRDGRLGLYQVLEIIESVDPAHGDVVEVAPSLDEDGRTVENARKILKQLLKQVKR
jgi:arginase family enzyme